MQTINISKIFILPTEPDAKVTDRFWYNPTNRILSRYTGSEWEPISVSPDDIDVSVNSQTMSLSEYIDAVTEGLLEVSSQIESISTNKANLSALDTKQDKLNYYNEGDNVANITSETTNTNNVVAKNITLGGYEREVNGEVQCQHGVTISEDGILSVSKQNNQYVNNLTTTIDGDTITLHSYYGEDNVDSTGTITGQGIEYINTDTGIKSGLLSNAVISLGYAKSETENGVALGYSGIGEGFWHTLGADSEQDLTIHSNGIHYETLDSNAGELSVKTEFFVGTKVSSEDEVILTPVIEGELVDKELTSESLETHIPTSSAVVSYVDNQTTPIKEDIVNLQHEVNLLSQQITISTHTSTFTSSSTDITNIYADDTKVALPGRIMIQPNINNVAPIYVGENITDVTKAFPLYPDQITDFYFSDINNFKIACDAVGDGCNFVIEWGVTNVVADIASNFTMYDDSGNKYKISIVDGSLTTTLI